jgi:hypothetical protein
MSWSEERRKEPRHGIARVAKIQLESGTRPLYCLVTDISEGGDECPCQWIPCTR